MLETVLNSCILTVEKHENRTHIALHTNDPSHLLCCAEAAVSSAMLSCVHPRVGELVMTYKNSIQ